ncbi:response regulator transcription factor [Clostridium intestinale]|uniref:Heme response regulator HssR n=1 Tax=Clostridium intestinale DSM 6191 TaxID=1121320 RepID=A0A1M5YLW9_9CLOT|nr:response regulator transcription factor [Clostridium intestinale]SHI12844.1 DNA-binding response regulator, OmpR family, contains REC and winged-helix (wHTH) domain [Clostridium intestinale DSM 6191]
MFSILVVEDDEILNRMICAKLHQESYHVFTSFDGKQALDLLDKEHIDLIISDIMMPNMNGYQLAKELRDAEYTIPILMITAKNQFEDMEKGFRAGTDDYMIKPISMRELVLRVKALLRRAQIANEKKLVVGDTLLDYNALTVKVHDEIFEMPPKEFYLLFKLLSNPNKIFTRQELLDEIWGMDTDVDDRTIDSHIKKLRRKFEHCTDFEIVTIRGLGYKAKI